MKTFPKVIYVKQEQDGDDEYLVAGADVGILAEMSEKVTVARYQLMDRGVVESRVDYTPIAK